MTLLLLPFRVMSSALAWTLVVATLVAIEVGVTRGRPSAVWALGGPLIGIVLGAIAGLWVWRSSHARPARAAVVLIGLVLTFAIAAVVVGASLGSR